MTQNRIQLPKGVSPFHYKLSLKPNFTDFSFLGSVKIDLNVSRPISSILLHSAGLTFQTIQFAQNRNSFEVSPKEITFHEKDETARIPVTLEEGSAELKINYSGEINDSMQGFYRSTFKDKDGKTHVVGCTQFEATDARKALPCWDEPSLKATFDLDITAPESMTVLSNTRVKGETKMAGNLKNVLFQTTPKMSTYLLAWFIGEYGRLSDKTKNGVEVSIYTPEENLPKGQWALSVATKTIDFFEDYFGIRYPLEKLDMVAISDFVNGAMENWGLVTYRDTAIYSDKNSSTLAREWVTSVVAHELAHQWFGNLVTMEWWSELWLNEGFATFMQSLANDRVYPELKIWQEFVEEKLERALYLDSLESSHPVEVPINNSKEINEVFDVISYKKGASLLRMLYEYIGDQSFKEGVTNYLKHYSYGNSDSDGLWKFLGESSQKDVRGFMHIFTRKQGYPLVRVDLEKSGNGRITLRLKQSRFLLNGEKSDSSDRTIWKIPIKIDINGQREWVYMTSESIEKEFQLKGELDYVFINSGAAGFFRSAYSPELYEKLKQAVTSKKVPVSDRFLCLSDANALYLSGRLPANKLLDLLDLMANETDQIVWSRIIDTLTNIHSFLQETPLEKVFNKFSQTLTNKIASSLGKSAKEGEDEGDKKMRGKILRFRALCRDEAVIEFYNEEFRQFTASPRKKEIDSDLFMGVVQNAVKQGGRDEFLAVKEITTTIKDPSKKNQALYALGCSKKPEVIDMALSLVLSDEVRKQDSFIIFSAVSRSLYGNGMSWSFFKEKYDDLRKAYTHDSLFSHFVEVVGDMRTEEQIEDAKIFFKRKNTEGYDKKLNQSIESATTTLKIKRRELPAIEKWLEKYRD